MTMDELIAKLEAAPAGSRELDVEIAAAIGLPPTAYRTLDQPAAAYPSYTTSLDAALTLVPEGWFWRVGSTTSFPAWAHVNKTHPDHGEPGINEFTFKRELWQPPSTPALALCIAALRARAAIAQVQREITDG